MTDLGTGANAFLALLTVLITAVYGPKALAKFQGKQKIAEIRTEGDSKAEQLYVTHVEKTLDRYEKQMLQMEIDFNKRMEEAETRFNVRFDELKRQMEKEKENERIYYLAELEKKDDRIDELEEQATDKDEIILLLRGN